MAKRKTPKTKNLRPEKITDAQLSKVQNVIKSIHESFLTMVKNNREISEDNLKIVSDNYDSLRSLTLSSAALCMGPRAVFAAQLQSGDLIELPLPMSVEWKSALLVKRETYTTPLARHLVGLIEILAREVNESLR